MTSFSRTMVVIAGGLLAVTLPVLLASAQTADTPNNPFAGNPAAVTAGGALFNSTCAACHGTGATGGRGPNLTSGRFVHGGSDYEIFTTIRGGVAGTEMPSFAQLPADDVWRLVTYIKSLSGGGNTAQAASGDAKAGEAIVFGAGNCTACHEVNGRGSDLASDLSAEGQNDLAAIRTGVTHSARPRPGLRPRLLDVTMKDGRKFSGLTRAEDSFSLDLEQKDGKLVMLDAKDIASKTDAGSTTPANTLSAKQVDDVVAYLAGLKQRDFSQTAKTSPAPVLPYDRLAHADAEPQNWATYWGSYDGHHFSRAEPDQHRQCRQSDGALGDAADRRLHHGSHAPGGGRGDVHVRLARRGLCPGCPQRHACCGASSASRTSRTPTRSIPSIAAWRCWMGGSLSAPWTTI